MHSFYLWIKQCAILKAWLSIRRKISPRRVTTLDFLQFNIEKYAHNVNNLTVINAYVRNKSDIYMTINQKNGRKYKLP